MDVDEIAVVKATQKTTVVDEVIDEDASEEEIVKVSPYVVVEPVNENDEIVNHEDEANEWMITTCISFLVYCFPFFLFIKRSNILRPKVV